MITALIILSIFSSVLWILQMILSYAFCMKELQEPDYIGEIPPISVILPSFNEDPEHTEKTINSILVQKHVELELIVIDDGSNLPIQVPFSPKIKLIRLEKNAGKRNAQIAGIEISKYDWIATVDSDTVLDQLALFYLYQATVKQKAEAVTGTVFVSNRKQNILTKIISCMYGLSIFQQRAEQAYFGSVTCCSGALSIYKKSVILEHKEDYLNQIFFGRKSRAGDDRHLTSLFILSGYKVGWTSKARCWTNTPSTFKSFLKQQLRWIRSNGVEFAYLLRNFKKWNLPFGWFNFKLIYFYFYRVLLYIFIIVLSIQTSSLMPVSILITSLLFASIVKCVLEYLVKYSPSRETSGVGYLVAYVLFEFFVLTPVVVYGMATPYRSGWLTRENIKH